ncbi:MAG: deoxynucleoside kinase [Bacteroidales bacterium]|nr:deoxynucleoside kinase [Bacteroidales bacterium]
MHIAIAGNIGSGKTTLTKLLSKHYGYRALFESTDNNPYINSFYEDMRRWSFNLQIYFLHTRIRQMMEIKDSGADFVQDRTIYEDAYIFAPNLHAMGLLNTRDFENYQQLFELLSLFIKAPDLLIYLRGDVPSLIRQIQRRGREYENAIRLDYLTNLNNRYEKWIEGYDKGRLLVVDINDCNFADNPEDLGVVINKIDAEFNGLF